MRTMCAQVWRQERVPQARRPVRHLCAHIVNASWGLVAKEVGQGEGAWLLFICQQVSVFLLAPPPLLYWVVIDIQHCIS